MFIFWVSDFHLLASLCIFGRLSLQYHPDKNKQKGAQQKFEEINNGILLNLINYINFFCQDLSTAFHPFSFFIFQNFRMIEYLGYT